MGSGLGLGLESGLGLGLELGPGLELACLSCSFSAPTRCALGGDTALRSCAAKRTERRPGQAQG